MIMCLLSCAALTVFAGEAVMPSQENLLVNPDWEDGIDGWEILANNQEMGLEDHTVICSILYQDVPVESYMEGKTVKLSGSTGTAPEDPTQEEILLSMMICAQDGSSLYDEYVSEKEPELAFHEIIMDIPEEAAFIRVSLEIRKQTSENSFNFSSLCLETVERETVEENPFVRITDNEGNDDNTDDGKSGFIRIADEDQNSTGGFARTTDGGNDNPAQPQTAAPEESETTTPEETETEPETTAPLQKDNPPEVTPTPEIEYTRIEYIQATGAQYIDTGFADPEGTTIEYAAAWDLNAKGYYAGYMVGAKAGDGSANGAYYDGYWEEWRLDYASSNQTKKQDAEESVPFAVGTRYEVKYNTANGEAWMEVNDIRLVETQFSKELTSTDIMVFASEYQLSEENSFGGLTSGRLYYAKIWNHYGELVRDFVPVIQNSDGAAGLYDLVEQKFYGNDGEEEFTAGPQLGEDGEPVQEPVHELDTDEFTRIEYIQATGTQYIDTGFADMSGTTIEYAATWDLNAKGYYSGYIVGAQAAVSPYGSNGAFYEGYWEEWKLEYGSSNQVKKQYDEDSVPFAIAQKYNVKSSTVYGNAWMEVDDLRLFDVEFKTNVTSTNIMVFATQYQLSEDNFFGGPTAGRLFYAKIWNHYGELVRDFVPVIQNSDGAVGLFDLVEQKFYANSGEGSFGKGPVVDGQQTEPPTQPVTQPPTEPQTEPPTSLTEVGSIGPEQDVEYLQALVETGKAYYYGTAQEGYNREKAQACFREAAEAEYGEGWYYYANLLMNCTEDQRYERAMGCYSRAAECGFGLGYVGQGLLYENGLGTQTDFAKAYELYSFAAEVGYPEGYCGLGNLYQFGNGAVQDEQVAMEYYKMALNSTDFMWRNYAKCQIAKMYMKDYPGIGLDYSAAYDWFMKAADEGYGNGFLGIGDMFYSGKGVEKDYAQAFTWFERAAAHGNVTGMYDVAFMLDHEIGVPQDYEKAFEYYIKAANLGDDDAMYALGVMFESGHGVAADYAQARYWLDKAADFTDDASLLESIGEELAYIASQGY